MEKISQLPKLPPRRADSNKGSYGRVLVVAGSRGMSGAAVLCAGAALRGGAGLVRVATPREVWPLVAAGNPCYMTLPLHQDAGGHFTAEALAEVLETAQASTVVALGPGLGRSPELTKFVGDVVSQATVPVVLDADGLNACAERIDLLDRPKGPVVITPHPGEFGRLVGKSTAQVQAARAELAGAFAKAHGLIVLLKGHETIVTDGSRVYVNATGNPGMATAGSGDVLTGLVAALLGQGLDPFAAAQLGAHVHGLAGDLARDEFGEVGLIASDLIDFLPKALKGVRGERF
jgi:ADP-dependent NAD(P)H-hydrate dehydratase